MYSLKNNSTISTGGYLYGMSQKPSLANTFAFFLN